MKTEINHNASNIRSLVIRKKYLEEKGVTQAIVSSFKTLPGHDVFECDDNWNHSRLIATFEKEEDAKALAEKINLAILEVSTL